ncbi:MAG: TRAP transporter small permease subunit [Desulfobacterales bacterium]|nr:MAG: TRAP transporter small permease subunit [Desulfobacterales bacterium]
MFILRILERFSDYVEKAIKVSIILSMAGIVLFVNLAVFFRYVLSDPLTWTTEISSYLLVYTVLFGASIALRHNQFVKVEALSNLLPNYLKILIVLLSQLVIALFLVVCIGSPSMLIKKAILTKTVSPALGIPMANLYRLLRIGFIFMLFFLCVSSVEVIKGGMVSGDDRQEAI